MSEMTMSAEIGELVAALTKARPDFLPVLKDKKGQVGGQEYWYATLDSVMDACLPALAKNGVTVMQAPGLDGDTVTVTTVVAHTSGQWMRSVCGARADEPKVSKNGNPITSYVQESGKVITFLKRYALCAVLAVSADEDTDGKRHEAAEQIGAGKAAPSKPAKPKPAKPANPDHHESWRDDAKRFCAALKDRQGLDYDTLAAYLEAHGRYRPSAMDNDGRKRLWAELTDGLAVEVTEWAARGDS